MTNKTSETSLNQTEVWVDRAGVTHDLDRMSVRYKANVLRFLERRAPAIVRRASIDASVKRGIGLASRSSVVPCVLGVSSDGEPIECAAARTGNEWAHGVWHGLGPAPGSMAFDSVEDSDGDRVFDAIVASVRTYTDAEALELIRVTPLVRRLAADVEAGLGGDDG